jgi:amino acid transporter
MANFRDPFEGKATGYGLTNSLVKIIFSYAGYENAFNIVNEIQVSRHTLNSMVITDTM